MSWFVSELVMCEYMSRSELVVRSVAVNHAIYESTPAPMHEMSLEQFRRTIDVNLTSSFVVLKEYLSRLAKAREQGAEKWLEGVAVVMIGSTGA